MSTYYITFMQLHAYEIEAENAEEAYENAEEEFHRDMRASAHMEYDDYCIERDNEDGTSTMMKDYDSF